MTLSRTALMAAAARAAHLIVDDTPHVFSDPLAAPLLGERAEELLAYHRLNGAHPVLAGARAQVVCRSRVAEDALHASGHTQYVLLGAGLDSYAHRAAPGVRVFEVDLAATQDYKRSAAAGLDGTPAYVTAGDDLLPRLAAAGLDASRPVTVAWLGVTMYLTPAEVAATLGELSQFPAGSHVVLDFMVPAGDRDAAAAAYVEAVAPMNAAEPWLSFFAISKMCDLMRDFGFEAEISGQHQWLGARTDALQPSNLAWIASGLRT